MLRRLMVGWLLGIAVVLGVRGVYGDALSLPDASQVLGYDGGTLGAIDLGTLGGSESKAFGVNEYGVVVGQSRDAAGTLRPFVWHGGTMTDPGTPAGAVGEAWAVGGDGTVVGSTVGPDDRLRAFRTTGAGVELHAFADGYDTWACGVNDSGQTVGYAGPFAYLWDGETTTALDPLLESGAASAADINNASVIVGRSTDELGYWHATIWDSPDASARDLGTLGGAESAAHAINELGYVVGQSRTVDGDWRAFASAGAGPMTDLGTLGGSTSIARDINNYGYIVGGSRDASNAMRAFMFYDGVMTDLNDLLAPGADWTLVEATGINDSGQIVGWGWHENRKRAFMLDVEVVPEPATLGLVGLAVLGVLRRRRCG